METLYHQFRSDRAAKSLSSPGSLMCNKPVDSEPFLEGRVPTAALLVVRWEPQSRGLGWMRRCTAEKRAAHPWSWPCLGSAGALCQGCAGDLALPSTVLYLAKKSQPLVWQCVRAPCSLPACGGVCAVAAGHPHQHPEERDISGTRLKPV